MMNYSIIRYFYFLCFTICSVFITVSCHDHSPPPESSSNSNTNTNTNNNMAMNDEESDIYANVFLYPTWTPLLSFHAFMMVILCFICIPIGIVLAFYQSKLHKYFQTVTVSLILLSALLALIDVGSADSGHHFTSAHGKIGFTLFLLFISQFIMGWLVKYKNMEYRSRLQFNAEAIKTYAHQKILKSHRILALCISLLIPLTTILGIVHGTGITPTDHDIANTAAHLGFGSALSLGGLYQWYNGYYYGLYTPASTRYTPLVKEYLVWFFFGIVIVITQRNWLRDGWLNEPGVDTQHVLIGVLVLITTITGLSLIKVARKDNNKLFKQVYRVPLAVLYIGLGIVMAAHTQSTMFASMMHKAFGSHLILIGGLVLFIKDKIDLKDSEFQSTTGLNSPDSQSLYQSISSTEGTNDIALSNSNPNNKSYLDNNLIYECVGVEKYISLRCLLLASCGVVFAGSSKYSAIGASKLMHPPIYILMLICIGLAIFTWFVVLLHYVTDSLQVRKALLSNTNQGIQLPLTIKTNHNNINHSHIEFDTLALKLTENNNNNNNNDKSLQLDNDDHNNNNNHNNNKLKSLLQNNHQYKGYNPVSTTSENNDPTALDFNGKSKSEFHFDDKLESHYPAKNSNKTPQYLMEPENNLHSFNNINNDTIIS